ncbi:MAG: pirin family protein, partial [Gammaproteobacteria bacterium]
PTVDPLLMVDELRSPYREDFSAGFPPHPHRGMQTLTYMLSGGIIHEDSMGNRGEIRDGGVQWMSAGSGVIHSEMPTQDTEGLHGFQLWFNLPSAQKMNTPRYRDIPATELPVYSSDDVSLVAIAGDWFSEGHQLISGPLTELQPIAQMADVQLAPGATLCLDVEETANAAVFVFEGGLGCASPESPCARPCGF